MKASEILYLSRPAMQQLVMRRVLACSGPELVDMADLIMSEFGRVTALADEGIDDHEVLEYFAKEHAEVLNPSTVDLTGKRFGRLLVIDLFPSPERGAHWNCVCDCGTSIVRAGKHLTQGERIESVQSCGCYGFEVMRAEAEKRVTHGLRKQRPFLIWLGMRKRCENPANKSYPAYGGRGIKICEEWRDPVVFVEWAKSNGYADNLSIDRIDNDKGYSPDNCRWVDWFVQANNRRVRCDARVNRGLPPLKGTKAHREMYGT